MPVIFPRGGGPVAWRLCPPDYYDLGLEERRAILGAHSTSQLCKACLFKNRNFTANTTTTTMANDDDAGGGEGTNADPTNSGYYLIVIQYAESINVKKLGSELRGLRPPGPGRFDPGYFADLRLAPEEASAEHTGYGRNGVFPFGMLDGSIPVIVCESIVARVRPKFIWMGGGHRDWKLGMAVSEFLRGVDAIVLDVSEPRA
jgi:prolyl-tRNA editing enzyme YbaK/EbsC (Cys-tRNA(Pro) deacylase)